MIDRKSWQGLEVLVVSPTPTHPVDHGNRKRVFAICRALQIRGARVHFVHYPAEHDWRFDRPERHERAMREQWDSYQLLPPTRSLHTAPIGVDHEIDEWADPSVSQYLAWACSRRRYDVAIVNYTWMSFALQALPPSVFKVLDTHDVFSNRRELLESNGVKAEFFHTTPEGETTALARADLVWAIKDAEADYFARQLGVADCLTMLHAEPQQRWWTSPPSLDGWLRAGVIGARNSVNRQNLLEFLKTALPVFEHYMAPVKIVIAGGCSDDFTTLKHPNLEVIGRVADVEHFYREVDVVIAPVRFSSGLKIKVCEALASSAPVIAHAHAMEGYPTGDPLHRLPSFEAMALELAKLSLSFDEEPLLQLSTRSQTVCRDIQREVDAAFAATRQRIGEKLATAVCIVAPMAALDPACLLYDHLHAVLDYFRFFARVELFFLGAPAEANQELLRRYDLQHHVFVEPALSKQLGEAAPENWTALELAELLEVRSYERAYLMTDCRQALQAGSGRLRQIFVRHDAVEIAGGDADEMVEELRSAFEIVVVGAAPSRIETWRGAEGVAQVVWAPFQRSEKFTRVEHSDTEGAQPELVLLASKNDPAASAVSELCKRLGANLQTIDLSDRGTSASVVRPRNAPDPLAGLAAARALVSVAAPRTALSAILEEAALRAGVPRIRLARGGGARGLFRFASPLWPGSLARLLETVAAAVTDEAQLEALRDAAEHEQASIAGGDAGWAILWTLLQRNASSEVDSAPPSRLALLN